MLTKFHVMTTLLLADLKARHESERGATAVEYGLMVALIAAAIITAVTLIGTNLDSLFTTVAGDLKLS